MEEDSNLHACPYLGLSSDASVSRLVATSAHRCHRWATPQTVEKEHQVSYCLRDNHLNCPWFVHPGGNLSSRREQHNPVSRKRRVAGVAALLSIFLLASVVVRMLIWPAFFEGNQGKTAGGAPVATATSAAASGGMPVATVVGEPVPIATAPSAQPTVEATPPPTAAQPTTLPIAAQPTVGATPTATRAAPTATAPLPTSAPAPTARPQVTPPAGALVHEVQQGDTIYGLATAHGVTVEDIVKANNLTDRGSIRVGQKLIIPPAQ